MNQIALSLPVYYNDILETHIKIDRNELLIPEGINTIPCTHGIHKFAGKFIPNIPRFLIREILPQEKHRIILDPFCGSGTTLVEAALEGRPFLGLDIDPLSVAISQVKTKVINEDDLNLLYKYWMNHNYEKNEPSLIPEIQNLIHWFKEKCIEELTSIKAACLELPEPLRLFSLIVFSSIIRRVSNADDQTQKTYVSHTLLKNPPLPSELFPVFISRAIEGMRQYYRLLPNEPKGSVVQGDATNLLGINYCNDVITSPPYIDSIDYCYNQMLEYYWLLKELGIDSYKNFKTLRKKPMGFRLYNNLRLSEFWQPILNPIDNAFDTVCRGIGDQSPKEEIAIRSFFYDYWQHVKAIHKIQLKGGKYICIVGNSFIRGTTVDTSEFIKRIHLNNGYKLLHHYCYEIRRHYMKFPRRSNSRTIKTDNILIFEVVK